MTAKTYNFTLTLNGVSDKTEGIERLNIALITRKAGAKEDCEQLG